MMSMIAHLKYFIHYSTISQREIYPFLMIICSEIIPNTVDSLRRMCWMPLFARASKCAPRRSTKQWDNCWVHRSFYSRKSDEISSKFTTRRVRLRANVAYRRWSSHFPRLMIARVLFAHEVRKRTTFDTRHIFHFSQLFGEMFCHRIVNVFALLAIISAYKISYYLSLISSSLSIQRRSFAVLWMIAIRFELPTAPTL